MINYPRRWSWISAKLGAARRPWNCSHEMTVSLKQYVETIVGILYLFRTITFSKTNYHDLKSWYKNQADMLPMYGSGCRHLLWVASPAAIILSISSISSWNATIVNRRTQTYQYSFYISWATQQILFRLFIFHHHCLPIHSHKQYQSYSNGNPSGHVFILSPQ